MATIFSLNANQNHYEIRTAGQTLRLYTNKVLHTQYNPKKILTGSVWDLFFIPSLWLPKNDINSVLVLGVGGGACIHQYIHYTSSKVVGIEIDENHIQLGKKYFGLTHPRISLKHADAVKWIDKHSHKFQSKAKKFSIIIEDLFHAFDGEPQKINQTRKDFLKKIDSMLCDSGIFIANFPTVRDSKNFCELHKKLLAKRFKSSFRFYAPACDNSVTVFTRQRTDSSSLRKKLRESSYIKNSDVRYNVRPFSL